MVGSLFLIIHIGLIIGIINCYYSTENCTYVYSCQQNCAPIDHFCNMKVCIHIFLIFLFIYFYHILITFDFPRAIFLCTFVYSVKFFENCILFQMHEYLQQRYYKRINKNIMKRILREF